MGISIFFCWIFCSRGYLSFSWTKQVGLYPSVWRFSYSLTYWFWFWFRRDLDVRPAWSVGFYVSRQIIFMHLLAQIFSSLSLLFLRTSLFCFFLLRIWLLMGYFERPFLHLLQTLLQIMTFLFWLCIVFENVGAQTITYYQRPVKLLYSSRKIFYLTKTFCHNGLHNFQKFIDPYMILKHMLVG